MNIHREKLHELLRTRAAKRDELDQRMKADNGDEPMPDEDAKAVDTLIKELEHLEVRIDRCERAIKASAPAKADDDDRDDDEDDDEEKADDDEDDDDKDDDKKRLRRAGSKGMASVIGGTTKGGVRVWARPKGQGFGKNEPGFRVARFMIGLVHRRWHGHEKALEFVDNRFHDDVVTRALNYSVVA